MIFPLQAIFAHAKSVTAADIVAMPLRTRFYIFLMPFSFRCYFLRYMRDFSDASAFDAASDVLLSLPSMRARYATLFAITLIS